MATKPVSRSFENSQILKKDPKSDLLPIKTYPQVSQVP